MINNQAMKKISIITLICVSIFPLLCYSNNVSYLSQLDNSIYMEYANLKMELVKDGKIMRYYDMEFYRKGDKMRMEFTAPAVEKGRKMLNDNKSLWMFLPRTSKVLKLPFKQSFMGSDASNNDLMRMSYEKDYNIVNTNEENGDIILTLEAKDLEVAYNKVIDFFDKSKKIPKKLEMYSLSKKLIKTLTFDNIIKVDDIYMPSLLIIKDEVLKKSETKLYYTNIKRNNTKSDDFFTLGSLKR